MFVATMITDFEIRSLKGLLNILPTLRPDQYKSVARDMHIDEDDLKPYMTWRTERYSRNCIVRTDQYELILLCWDKGHQTSIHCHGGEECWVYNASGRIMEEHYDFKDGKLSIENSEELIVGEVSYMNDDLGYHKLKNVANGRSLSLHLYMNPIDNCTSWCESTQSFVPVKLAYDTFEGKPV